MKPKSYFVIFTCLLLGGFTSIGQQVFWKKMVDKESLGNTISMTKAKNFIIGGIDYTDNKTLIASYDKNGNKVFDPKLCNSCNVNPEIIFSTELADRRLLFLTRAFYIFVTDSAGIQSDTAINIKSKLPSSGSILNALYRNDELIILSYYKINSKLYGNVLSRINTTSLKIISQQVSQDSSVRYAIAFTPDSSMIEYLSNKDMITIRKTNALSQIVWIKTLGIANFSFNDFIVTTDQKILILGNITTQKTLYQFITSAILIALNENADSLWKKVFSPVPIYPDENFSIILRRIRETHEGDFVLVGANIITNLGADVNIVKVNANGQLIWEKLVNIKQEGGSEGSDFLFDDDQNIIITGSAGLADYTGPERAFILKLSNPLTNSINQSADFSMVYPNPCSEELTIEFENHIIPEKIELYTIDGTYVKTIPATSPKLILNTNDLASGLYFCKFFTKQKQLVKKFFKL